MKRALAAPAQPAGSMPRSASHPAQHRVGLLSEDWLWLIGPRSGCRAARITSGCRSRGSAHREEVAERLRHLLVVDAHEAVVHPHVGEAVAGGAAGLRDLVLVVRELEVHAAAVDVEMRAEQRGGHRRALDVPAGPARARASPTGSPGLACFHSTNPADPPASRPDARTALSPQALAESCP
jgi:hypothetical protein